MRIADGRVTPYPVARVAGLDIRTLARAADGSLWVAPMTGGLYRVQGGLVTDFGLRHGLTNNVVESLYAGPDGVVWAGTTGAGPVSALLASSTGWPDGRCDGRNAASTRPISTAPVAIRNEIRNPSMDGTCTDPIRTDVLASTMPMTALGYVTADERQQGHEWSW